MSEEKTDLRIVKTHKTIRNALIELLSEKPFDKIAVQDILDRALVNRSTFYKYYSGKSDLAGKMIADFKAQYADLLEKRFSGNNLPQILEEIPQTLFELRHTMLALWKIETKRHHLYQDMFDMIKERFIRYATVIGCRGDLMYQAHIIATLALTSAKYYFKQDRRVDFEQTRRDIQLVVDIIESLGK